MIIDIDQNLENRANRLFANYTKMSTKIESKEVTERLQHNLNNIYTSADENLMMHDENKFEHMSHGDTKNAEKGIFKTMSGQIIKETKHQKTWEIQHVKIFFPIT